jgi:flagellin
VYAKNKEVVTTMDVKDVSQSGGARAAPVKSRLGRAVSSDALVSSRVPEKVADSVSVEGLPKSNSSARIQAVTTTNEVINATNIAAEATTEIKALVDSIGGIVELAGREDTSPQRTEVLEQEANDLIAEIQRRAQTPSASGIKPLAGDKIRLELEEGLGRRLEFLLPSDAQDAFGLGPVRFPNKEAILDTVAKVAVAQEQIENLRGAVDKTISVLRETVSELDVATQNSEASQANVRDVNQAANLAQSTRQGIVSSPGSALGSVAALDSRVLNLLE